MKAPLPVGKVWIGPTLFWSIDEPRVGSGFAHQGARYVVEEVTPDPADGGFLLIVRPVS